MKTLLMTSYIFCAMTVFGMAQSNKPLTNDVPIVDYGMRQAFCDNFYDTDKLQALHEMELNADKDLAWILHNTSTNEISVIFLSMTNSFDLKLFGTNGVEIPKSDKGKAMSAGPKSITNAHDNPYVRREGAPPGGISTMDFPRLTELFQFPSDGTYIFEARYWGWSPIQQKFILSEPVRLRVIKKSPTADAKPGK